MIKRLLSAAAALMLVAAVFQASSDHANSRWGADYIPNVELVTQDGRTVRFYDDVIKDRMVVISFIFTSCQEVCPLMTARLAQVYEKLGDAAGRDFHFVSISIDPDNDTPQRMKEHAEAFGADPRWLFLTGKPENVHLVRHRLGERSRRIVEHRSDVLLRNDITNEWARDSVFADLDRLAHTIRMLDPERRNERQSVAALSTSTGVAPQELPGQALFVKGCASCHTIGKGDRVGPDLKDVTKRRSAEWVSRFLQHPARVRAEGGPAMEAMMKRFPAVRMPNLQLSSTDAADIISYLEARSRPVASGNAKSGAHGAHHGAHQAAGAAGRRAHH